MKSLYKRFIAYVTSGRMYPQDNRRRVGQNLMVFSVLTFVVFIINFAVIIGTDSKFGEDLSKRASQVHQRTEIVQAKRGTIYDRNGNVIAEDSTTYSVYAIINKQYVSSEGQKLYVQPSQYDKVAAIFEEFLGIEEDYTKELLGQENLVQTAFGPKGSNISYATMKAITEAVKEAEIEGIAFTTSPGRMYPNGTFASEFIGSTTLHENEDLTKSLIGSTGMELFLDDILSGTDGLVTYQKDKNGLTLLGTAEIVQETIDGKDIYTTLSAPMQSRLEAQMDIFQEKVKGKQASATLVNAKTGEILATTQRPTFNADTGEGLNAEGYYWNSQLYQSSFEPGSTMKVLTLASALDRNIFDADEVYLNDKIDVADATIRDWDVNAGYSDGSYMTMAQGFAHSSNIAMVKLEKKMGDDLWLNYLTKYRFGLPTRFGMGYEDGGSLPEDNEVTMAMSAFGQGINVTQIQMLRAFLAISNDGVMLEPQFISKIEDSTTGSERHAIPEIVGNPVGAKAARKTRDYMVTVGTDPVHGTLYWGGPVIQVDGYNIAVKSGTAQIAEDGAYLTGENDLLHSVVAMIPAEDPQFLMYVSFRQPEKKFNITRWQDIFNPVLSEAMILRDILLTPVHSASDEEMPYKLPELIGEVPGPMADTLRQNLLHPIILGTGSEIIKASVKSGKNVPANKQILLLTDDFTTLPDMYGWTRDNVKTFAKWMGISITFKGKTEGTVTAQSRQVGTKLKGFKELTVTLD